MSIEIMNLVLNHSKAKGRAKLVLMGIANHQGDHGAWPSIATLARYTNESERSVKRDIQELIKLGELTVQKNQSPMGDQYKTNLYWVTIEAGVTNGAKPSDSSGKSGVTVDGTLTINRNLKETRDTATKISSDYQPNESLKAWAKATHPQTDIDQETEKFVDYWLGIGGARGRKLDWDATWRNWIRNSNKYSKSKSTSKDDFNDWLKKMEALENEAK